MYSIIIATDINGAVGLKGGFPWHCPKNIELFNKITSTRDSKGRKAVLIVGSNTAKTLNLQNRNVLVIGKNTHSYSPTNALILAESMSDNVFVIGGRITWNTFLHEFPDKLDTVYVSLINGSHDADSYLSLNMSKYTCMSRKRHDTFESYILKNKTSTETTYMSVLQNIMKNGSDRCGRNGDVRSVFGQHLEFDMKDGFPLITTKKMFFRGIVEELLFFLRGDTDTKTLEEKGVNIWMGNTNREFLDARGMSQRKEGVMGPMYGYQWRHFNAPYDEESSGPKSKGIDQLKELVDGIKKDPMSRRHLMTDYNPSQVHEGVLYPCHSLILHFYVNCDNRLDMFCYIRSSDTFLGLPFNIASSAMMLYVVSSLTNHTPGRLLISLGDAHIYSSHMEHVETQLKRAPFEFPILNITAKISSLKDIDSLKASDFVISGYKSHPGIKAKMVA
jgi:thymidylate synthase